MKEQKVATALLQIAGRMSNQRMLVTMNDCTTKPCSKCGEFLEINETNFRLKKIKGCYRFYSICRLCELKSSKLRNSDSEYLIAQKEYNKKRRLNQITDPARLERIRERDRLRNAKRRANPIQREAHKLTRQLWEQTPNGRFRRKASKQRRKARLKGLEATMTSNNWSAALSFFNGCCAVCERPLKDLFGATKASMDHWIPITKGGATTPLNIVPLCSGVNGCNNSKRNSLAIEWLVAKFGKRKAKEISKRIEKYFEWVKRSDIAT